MDVFGIDDSQLETIMEPYGISKNRRQESINLIREWYSKQPHLPKIEFNDRELERLLFTNKFSVEESKRKIDNFYTARTIIPELFDNRDPWDPYLSKVLDIVEFIFVPKLTKENYRIQITRISSQNTDDYDVVDYFKTCFMIGDIRSALDVCAGDIYVFDFANVRIGHVLKMTPPLLKKTAFVFQHCYGSRVKAIHILNLPEYAEVFLQIFKSFAKKKVADRIFVHHNLDSLRKNIPHELLPNDLGGTDLRTCKELADVMKKYVKSQEWREWFIKSSTIKSDESKRPHKSQTMADDLIGLRGTFRKLDID